MPDQPVPPEGTHNPRSSARPRKRPTRRSAGVPANGRAAAGAPEGARQVPASATSSHRPVDPGATGTGRPVNPGATGTARPVNPGATGTARPVNPGAQGATHQAAPANPGATRSVTAYPNGHDAYSQEAAARAAYDNYVATTNTPHPGAASQGGGRPHQSGYAGYAQTVHPRPAAPLSSGAGGAYGDVNRYKKKGKKKTGVIGLVVAAVILVAIGVGVYFYLNPLSFNITVNGMTRTIDRGTTLGDIIADGVVSPTAGNLVAVDGEVIEEGAGTPFTGTVNGDAVDDPSFELHSGDTVQMDNGVDVTEEYDVTTEEGEPGQVEVGSGALHVYVPGEPSQVEMRTGKVSGKTITETVAEGIDNVYLKYNANTDGDKVVALTFDDGPWPTTDELLDVLKENDAVATFFTISEQINDKTDYAATVRRASEEGHQIGTHSYDHASTGGGNGVDMTRQSPEKQIEEVVMGQEEIAEATGKEASKVFRSPGGNYSGDIIWNLQPYVTSEIGWNIDTEDWRKPGVDAIVNRILQAQPGDVILMHDGGGDRSQTIEALRIALPQLKAKGFSFVTIDQLLAYDDAREIAAELIAQQNASE